MQTIQPVTDSIYWVGANDRRLALFENIFPLPHGVSYNAYVIVDEKTALMDTIDIAFTAQLLENLEKTLSGRALDYLVISHVEPDHGASIAEICARYPDTKIVGNQKMFNLINQFFPEADYTARYVEKNEGDTLELGSHTLQFVAAPMVHWPEVMFSYETSEKVLFSSDAFGTFGALNGGIFADEYDFEACYLDEARRYYTNIVGKYGPQVQAAMKKLAGVEIQKICPLHGPVWRQDFDYILGKYDLWSRYEPEQKGVVIASASMYGHTENVANLLAGLLAQRGVRDIRMLDVSKTNVSELIGEMFKYSNIVLSAPTYNMGLYIPMHNLVHDMAALNLQNRKVSIIGNGSWAPQAPVIMQKMLGEMKGMEILGEPFVIKSAMKPEQMPALEALADTIAASVKG